MDAMKELLAKPLLAAALLSALACSSENAGASPDTAPQAAQVEEPSTVPSTSKFNFSTPGDTSPAPQAQGGFNFSIPDDPDGQGATGLGAVALPEDGSEDAIIDFDAQIAAPSGN